MSTATAKDVTDALDAEIVSEQWPHIAVREALAVLAAADTHALKLAYAEMRAEQAACQLKVALLEAELRRRDTAAAKDAPDEP